MSKKVFLAGALAAVLVAGAGVTGLLQQQKRATTAFNGAVEKTIRSGMAEFLAADNSTWNDADYDVRVKKPRAPGNCTAAYPVAYLFEVEAKNRQAEKELGFKAISGHSCATSQGDDPAFRDAARKMRALNAAE